MSSRTERERLRPIAFGALGLGMTVMAMFALVFAFGGKTIAGWFVPDVEVVILAAQLLLVGAVFQMADGVQVIAAHLLRGISDVKVPTAITLIAYWGIALPLAYLIGVRGPLGAQHAATLACLRRRWPTKASIDAHLVSRSSLAIWLGLPRRRAQGVLRLDAFGGGRRRTHSEYVPGAPHRRRQTIIARDRGDAHRPGQMARASLRTSA
jgi:hypothetical protein